MMVYHTARTLKAQMQPSSVLRCQRRGSFRTWMRILYRSGKFIIEKDKASIGMLQRMFKIGFNRAARIMDQLSDAGVVGPEEGTKPRKILMSMEEFENYIEESI